MLSDYEFARSVFFGCSTGTLANLKSLRCAPTPIALSLIIFRSGELYGGMLLKSFIAMLALLTSQEAESKLDISFLVINTTVEMLGTIDCDG